MQVQGHSLANQKVVPGTLYMFLTIGLHNSEVPLFNLHLRTNTQHPAVHFSIVVHTGRQPLLIARATNIHSRPFTLPLALSALCARAVCRLAVSIELWQKKPVKGSAMVSHCLSRPHRRREPTASIRMPPSFHGLPPASPRFPERPSRAQPTIIIICLASRCLCEGSIRSHEHAGTRTLRLMRESSA